MNVGFVMLAHAALHRAAQVARVLASEECPLVIHVDSRVGSREFAEFVRSLSTFDNIHLAPRRRCDWGTWGLVDASRGAADMLLERHRDVQHVALISGACLPIKPIPDLKAYLANHPDTDFIESVTIGDVPWTKGGLSEERFTLSFPFAWKRQKRLFDIWVDAQRLVRRRRRMPEGLEPHMGSQWWCLSRSTLERVLTDPSRPALDRYFRRVWIPDESYFQSLVRLYATKVESRSLTISKFDFQGKPHVFYDDHLLLLRQSSAFFARKIWPGANRLYRAFLEDQPVGTVTKSASAAHIDRTFAQAVSRRTQGRSGLVMASRFPRPGFENGLTAAPYSVFQGLSDIFEDFPGWISSVSGSRAHGHLYARNHAEFAGAQTGHAGALSDSPKLRDYDPEAFLRNLIWNTRGEHQSFQMSPRDSQGACEFIVQDRNATISVVSGAWAMPLLRSGRPVEEVRAEAARLQKIETSFLSRLRERRARARARIWTLAEFLERPVDPLQQILDDLSGADTHLLTELPVIRPMKGLVEFLQTLRNAGMNPHLAGEVSELLVVSPKRARSNPMRLS